MIASFISDPEGFAPRGPPTPSHPAAHTPCGGPGVVARPCCPAPAFAKATAGHRSLARRRPLRHPTMHKPHRGGPGRRARLTVSVQTCKRDLRLERKTFELEGAD